MGTTLNESQNNSKKTKTQNKQIKAKAAVRHVRRNPVSKPQAGTPTFLPRALGSLLGIPQSGAPASPRTEGTEERHRGERREAP